MSSPDYIPTTDLGGLAWLTSFARQLAATPDAYGQAPATAADVRRVVDEAARAMEIAAQPATRTGDAVAQKSAAMAQAKARCRRLARMIKAMPGVDSAALLRLGLRPDSAARTPIYAPQTAPLLTIVGATAGTQTVRFADAGRPTRRAKPPGAAHLLLVCRVSEHRCCDPREAEVVGGFSRGPILVSFEAADDAKTATYFARWVGRRGDHGAWSAPVSMTVAA